MTGYVGMLVCWYFGLLDPVEDPGAAGLGAVAVVEEWTTERDRYTPWLHRAVQGRVAGPLVQLRFISLISQSSADQQSVSRHTKVLLISLNSFQMGRAPADAWSLQPKSSRRSIVI